jgi:MoaA/NifB/PqqE/SkfB family radical SAM enzyme
MQLATSVKQFSSDKIFKHLDRVCEWLGGGNPPPITVELDMTNVCNHDCPECVASYFRSAGGEQLESALAERIVRELAAFGARGLIFTGGGEPLLHKDTPRMVELAHGLGLDVGFITNGTLLDPEVGARLLDHCVWLRVSLDAADGDTYRLTHGLNHRAFDKVLRNLRLLVEIKRRSGSRCTVGVGYLTCDATKGGMIAAARLCDGLGVDYLQYRPMQVHRGGRFDYDWTEVADLLPACLAHAHNGFDVLFSQHKYEMMRRNDYGRDYEVCYGHQFATTIGADAKMYLCCHLRGYDKYCLGDLRSQSVAEIWASDRRRQVAASIDFRDCIPLCRDNTFNQILWQIRQPREHANFL